MENSVYVLADSAERRSVARSVLPGDFLQMYQHSAPSPPTGITHQRYLQAMFNEDFGRGFFDKHWQDNMATNKDDPRAFRVGETKY